MERSWKVARSEEVLKGGQKLKVVEFFLIQAFQIGGISELLGKSDICHGKEKLVLCGISEYTQRICL